MGDKYLQGAIQNAYWRLPETGTFIPPTKTNYVEGKALKTNEEMVARIEMNMMVMLHDGTLFHRYQDSICIGCVVCISASCFTIFSR